MAHGSSAGDVFPGDARAISPGPKRRRSDRDDCDFPPEQVLRRTPDFRIEEAKLRPTPAMVAGYAQVPFVFAPGRKPGGPR
jgi:hypothetical protein